jgi:hypothetical protein
MFYNVLLQVLLDNSHDETFLSQLPDAVREEALALRRDREERHAAAAAAREAMQRDLEHARSREAMWAFSRHGGGGPGGGGGGGGGGPGGGGSRGGPQSVGRAVAAARARARAQKDGTLVLETGKVTQLLRLYFAPHTFSVSLLNRAIANLCVDPHPEPPFANSVVGRQLSVFFV